MPRAAHGEAIAKVRIEESQTEWEIIEGKTNCQPFGAGKLFKLKGYERTDQNDEKSVSSLPSMAGRNRILDGLGHRSRADE